MKLNISTIQLFIGVLILSGCTSIPDKTEFFVNVNSIGDAKENKTYILLPSNKGTKVDDLQFKEYATYVTRALQTKGFVQAETFQKANVSIFLGYGIGDPKEHKYTYSIPTWGKTGVSSSTTTGTIDSYGSSASYSGTTTYTPTYGVTGSTTHSDSYTTCSRFMTLAGVDSDKFRKSKKLVDLWRTTVTSSGSSCDLRRVFPVLVAASIDYIATNTRNKISVQLFERDDHVQRIKGLLPDSDGLETLWYASGHKKAEGTYKDGKRDGLYTWWYENGQKKAEGNFKNGEMDGLITTWHKNGQKKAEANYKDGKEDGLMTTWHKNGQKKAEANFKNGEIDGLNTWWHKNGQKKEEGTYKDGKLDGLRTNWHENGQKKAEGNY